MDVTMLLMVLGLVVLGAVAQRVAGLGFAMLVSPFLVLLLGPHVGVFMINVCGVVSSALIMPRVWRDIDWSMFRWLTVSSIAGSVPGVIAAALMDSGPLSIFVGGIVLIALILSLSLSRAHVVVTGKAPRAVAGFASGMTNAMAGVGGPAVSAYAVLTRWPQRAFAATLQPFFTCMGAVAVITKLIVDPSQAPLLDWWMWALIVVAIVIGIFGGERLQRHVSDRSARIFVITIAFIGAIMALVEGLIEVL
ncbi:sulfite exporter TauE/SafE family protein [Zhihengliuella sp.]|uniref:sulfite exporter TauE/SafE family protein n=1 Tax=Zhihengliuella sp. TaxID=1954483 RepID=UPI002811576E|nr:sulfite exporter TauE/SafE family protein [Zhihengliuella sp.]